MHLAQGTADLRSVKAVCRVELVRLKADNASWLKNRQLRLAEPPRLDETSFQGMRGTSAGAPIIRPRRMRTVHTSRPPKSINGCSMLSNDSMRPCLRTPGPLQATGICILRPPLRIMRHRKLVMTMQEDDRRLWERHLSVMKTTKYRSLLRIARSLIAGR